MDWNLESLQWAQMALPWVNIPKRYKRNSNRKHLFSIKMLSLKWKWHKGLYLYSPVFVATFHKKFKQNCIFWHLFIHIFSKFYTYNMRQNHLLSLKPKNLEQISRILENIMKLTFHNLESGLRNFRKVFPFSNFHFSQKSIEKSSIFCPPKFISLFRERVFWQL